MSLPTTPVLNLEALEYVDDVGPGFAHRYAVVGERIGAQKLGYSVTVLTPGNKVCPFHNHRHDEEMFFVLEGTGTLRFGDRTYPLRAGDFIACPPGGRDVAHQIINTGKAELRYLCISTREPIDVCEYPDSDKVGVYVGKPGARDLRLILRAGATVDYFDGER